MPDRKPEHEADSSAPKGMPRREFLRTVGIVGAGVASEFALPASSHASATRSPQTAAHAGTLEPGTIQVKLKVNGADHVLKIDPRTTLLDTLREHLDLTGTKKGCDHGQCGACTVHVNGRRVNACLSFAAMHDGDEITTLEGLGSPGHLHPMQQAFLEHDGYQCGYCTPGQLMSAVALLKEPCGPDDADVREAMSGNICRCGAYKNILAAIQQVRGSKA